ncbi:PepSY domain-containing protein [Pseudoleptotrichia goodfellowii]|uniref:Peptidase propeptide and YPEB domain protein n=1 Tax=Pseudoleptotrichia goodfellowii F0264 TaxID=596323 RepID=D0GNK3_9FUSO|nr:PepSY domain-containing protein [Pseudoleptotrichia goodfellowii]EEY34337.1 peptidase propeptide and YPEB domain protein [Pseudoleptotrichia goodfellowii F0264]
MKNRILNVMILGIMMLGVAGTANSASKSKNSKTGNRDVEVQVRNVTAGSYIGVARAKAIALKKVPGANDSHVTEVHLDREDGRMVYETEIRYNNTKYEFDIDATTGEIVKWKMKKAKNKNY